MTTIEKQKQHSEDWFRNLRDQICSEFEQIEKQWLKSNQRARGITTHDELNNLKEETPKFDKKSWTRSEGGGGVMATLKGNVFEKAGVNISTVYGKFSDEFRKEIPGTEEDASFYATGISVIAHMQSPFVPAVHFNTRFIVTGQAWFGGGADLNPIYYNKTDEKDFHDQLKQACDKHDPQYYPKFSKQCEDYFYITHRGESRGVGGIFFDYLQNDLDKDFKFVKDVGEAFLDIYPALVRRHMHKAWTPEHREEQLLKRGRYVEFNLLYDRGTRFGLMTGGNPEAVLTSMPPLAKWK